MFLQISMTNSSWHYYPIDNCHFIYKNDCLFLIDGDKEINLRIIGLQESVKQYLDSRSLITNVLTTNSEPETKELEPKTNRLPPTI